MVDQARRDELERKSNRTPEEESELARLRGNDSAAAGQPSQPASPSHV